MRRARLWSWSAALVAASVGAGTIDAGAPQHAREPAPPRPVVGFRLEANHGQTDAGVDFISRCRGYTAWVRSTGVVLGLSASDDSIDVIAVRLVGAAARRPTTGARLPGVSNYLIGRDESKWVRGAPAFAAARYADAWPGVGATWLGEGRDLRCDFDVAPGADESAIALAFDGAASVRVGDDGALRVAAPHGDVVVSAPVAYELVGAVRRPLAARWTTRDGSSAGFEVAGRDPSRTLVIDPSVTYSTYFGGSSVDVSLGAAVDSSGNVYVSGHTGSTDLPITSGAFQTTKSTSNDVFCSKFNATGSVLVYSTFVGSTGSDAGAGLAVDGSGAAYLNISTPGTDMPTTAGAVETTKTASGSVGALAKLNPSGNALAYCTYVNFGIPVNVVVDSSGDAFFVVRTLSTGVNRICELSPSGNSYLNTVPFGGSSEFPRAFAMDPAGSIYVAGTTTSASFGATSGAFQTVYGGATDGFVMKFTSGFAPSYATYLGGTSADTPLGIDVDPSGNAYVVGWTTSTDFPVSHAVQSANGGAQDAFVAKLSATGAAAEFSTYLGGTGDEFGQSIAVAPALGAVYVVGDTPSSGFPVSSDAAQSTRSGPATKSDAFLTVLRTDGAMHYSTYYGGTDIDRGRSIAVDSAGDAYLYGFTISTDFPTANAYDTSMSGQDAFLAKFGGVLTPFVVTATTLPDWTRTSLFSQQLASSGGYGAVVWSLGAGALPAGVSISQSGLVEGTPTVSGVFTFAAKATDALGVVATRPFTWTVNAPPTVSSPSQKQGTRDHPFTFPFQSTGGTPPVAWSVTTTLPPGLSFAGNTLSGTPTASGNFVVGAVATDSVGVSTPTTLSVTIVEPPRISSTSFPECTEGVRFVKSMVVVGGTPPYAWTVDSGELPFDNSIVAATGMFSTFTRPFGDYVFSLRVTDATGAFDVAPYAMRVNPSPQIDTLSLPPVAIGRPYAATLRTHDGTPPSKWTVSDGLPDGLAFDENAGAIGGTPTAAGEFARVFTIIDSCDARATRALGVSIAAPLDVAKKKASATAAFASGGHAPARHFFLELVAGTKLGVVVKPTGKKRPVVSATLRGASGAIVELNGADSRAGGAYRIRNFVVPETGRYFLDVSIPADFVNSASVAVSVTVAAKSAFGGTVRLDASKPAVEAVFGALAGAKATIVVKAAKGSTATPKIAGVLQNGVDLLVPADAKTKGRTVALKLKPPLAQGDVRVLLTGADAAVGDATWSVKLTQPKTYAFSLPDVPAGE